MYGYQREFKFAWREAGPRNHPIEQANSNQSIVNKETFLRHAGVWYEQANFGAGTSPGPPNRWIQNRLRELGIWDLAGSVCSRTYLHSTSVSRGIVSANQKGWR